MAEEIDAFGSMYRFYDQKDYVKIKNTFQIEFQDNSFTVQFKKISGDESGFYCVRIPNFYFKQKYRGSYYMISSESKQFTKDVVLPNKLLIDEDYYEDICVGVYVLMEGIEEEANIVWISFISGLEPLKDCDLTDHFNRCQSPVFTTPAYPEHSAFHGLFRASLKSNGFDIVFNSRNIPATIEPKGSFTFDLSDAFDMLHSGECVLRSRFVRVGLELIPDEKATNFTITNHSRKAVETEPRMFQYVPLRTFNGPVMDGSAILHNNCSQIHCEQLYKHPYCFGKIETRDKKKKSKFA